jgi:hypothetical protein
MTLRFSDRMIKILIFIFFTIVPLIVMLSLDRFDYYSAFDELKNATGIPRENLEIMNFWTRGRDYVVKVRVYGEKEFKVKFIKHGDSYTAELGQFYDEGWQPLSKFLEKNKIKRETNAYKPGKTSRR